MAASNAPLELIVGTQRVTPEALEVIEGGVIARLSGAGLLSVLDATFGGQASVEVWAAGLHPRAMAVTQIAMQGTTTLVTFAATGAVSLN